MQNTGTISQQFLDRVALLETSPVYKSAAAVSDAAAVTGGDLPPESAQPAPEEGLSPIDELRARAESADPQDRQAMLDAAQRLELVQRAVSMPAAAPQEQQVAPEAPPPEGVPMGVPEEEAPPPGPEAKVASHRAGRDITRFAVPLDDKTKQAAILADSEERPATMGGFRNWLSENFS